jgi:hypothetical protein
MVVAVSATSALVMAAVLPSQQGTLPRLNHRNTLQKVKRRTHVELFLAPKVKVIHFYTNYTHATV